MSQAQNPIRFRFRILRRAAAALSLLTLVLGLGLVAMAMQIWMYPGSTVASADAAIVLGASTWREQPSPAFVARIDHGIALYRAGRVRALIFTGGRSGGEHASNAEAARAFALARGVPASAIIVEPYSRRTWENLVYAKALAEPRGLHSFLIVSDPMHMKRAMSMAQAQRLVAYPSATTRTGYADWRYKCWFLRRETRCLMVYNLLSRVGRFLPGAANEDGWEHCMMAILRHPRPLQEEPGTYRIGRFPAEDTDWPPMQSIATREAEHGQEIGNLVRENPQTAGTDYWNVDPPSSPRTEDGVGRNLAHTGAGWLGIDARAAAGDEVAPVVVLTMPL